MVIHYFASQEQAACGRTGTKLNGTQDLAQISCKLCQRALEKVASEPVRKTPSLAELRAVAKAEKAAAVAASAAPVAAVAAAPASAVHVVATGNARAPRAE